MVFSEVRRSNFMLEGCAVAIMLKNNEMNAPNPVTNNFRGRCETPIYPGKFSSCLI
jgi:hypothetical protein